MDVVNTVIPHAVCLAVQRGPYLHASDDAGGFLLWCAVCRIRDHRRQDGIFFIWVAFDRISSIFTRLDVFRVVHGVQRVCIGLNCSEGAAFTIGRI